MTGTRIATPTGWVLRAPGGPRPTTRRETAEREAEHRPPTRTADRTGSAGVWLGSLLVLALVLAPVLAIVAIAPEARTWPVVAAMAGLVAYATALIATGLVYVGWRLTQGPATAWLIVALAVVSLQGIGVFGLMMGDSIEARTLLGWQTATSLPTVVLLATLRALRHRRLRFDPLVVGTLLGLALAVFRYTVTIAAPPFHVDPVLRVGFVVAAGIVLGSAFLALRDAGRPWLGRACAVAVALFGTATLALYFGGTDGAAAGVSVVAHLAGAVVVLSTAATVLHLALREDHETVEDLERRLEEVAASGRLERERRHEIGSIVAGICSASRLVRRTDELERDRARTLEKMLDSEMARLERLVDDRPLSTPTTVHVDDVIGPLVTAQQAQSRLVIWRPTGQTAVVSPDVLSEVVSILLENAARHAPGDRVDVVVAPTDGRLRILVSDQGPGVPPAMRDRLFDWQARGPASPGQGIGLHIARRLMVEAGGALEHIDDGPGATFAVTLPAPQHLEGRR